MPFVSKAQARWMFANHPKMAAKWAAHTPKDKKLPAKLHPNKKTTPKRKIQSKRKPYVRSRKTR